MEKKMNLLDFEYSALLWRIVGAVRRQAQAVPAFRDSHNGCIKIGIMPSSRTADAWLGGLNDYRHGHLGTEIVDGCQREFLFKADAKGVYTLHRQNDNGAIDIIHAEACVAAMMAYASRKTWLKYQHMRSEPNLPHIRPILHLGAVVCRNARVHFVQLLLLTGWIL